MSIRPKAVIYDLDGCLVNTDYRHFTPETWCWEKANKISLQAPVNGPVVDNLLNDYLNYAIIILTARPQHISSEVTLEWINTHGIPFTHLMMMDKETWTRQEAQRTVECVEEIQAAYKRGVVGYIQEQYEVVAAYDDQQKNVDIFVEAGIMTFKTIIP